jgi:creatinine amidohydrolase
MKRKTFLAAELSWTEFRDYMKEDTVLIIPTGMLEEHGLHNPLGTDSIVAEHCAAKIAERSGALAAPVFPYGYGPQGRDFPGQVSLSPGLLRKIYYAYAASYAKHGVRRFLFVNGHGGNLSVLRAVTGDLWRDFHALCSITEWWVNVPQLKPELVCDDHGGKYETSCVLAIRPELVDLARAKDAVPDAILGGEIHAAYSVSYHNEPFFAALDDYSLGRVGNLGASPREANVETGEAVLEAYISFNADLVEELGSIDRAALEQGAAL